MRDLVNMATSTYDYNELTHTSSATDINTRDPMYSYESHFPERISRLQLTNDLPTASPKKRNHPARNRRNRDSLRYKTQPITFDEIKEVDEETTSPEEAKENLKSQFTQFSKSMDGLVPGFGGKSSDKVKRVSPLVASNPSSESQSSTKSSTDSSETKKGMSLEEHAKSLSIQREHFRQRRKKRASRSIDEAPEIDKNGVNSG